MAEYAIFIATIPFDDAPRDVVFEIPMELWSWIDDQTLQADKEIGGLLIGESFSDELRAVLHKIDPYPEGTVVGADFVQLPAGWREAEHPGFMGTWHVHPGEDSPSNPSAQDYNHLMCMIRPDFWPFLLVTSPSKQRVGDDIPFSEMDLTIAFNTKNNSLIYTLDLDRVEERDG